MKKLLLICLLVSSVLSPGKSHNLYEYLLNSDPDSLQIVTTQDLSALLMSTLEKYESSGLATGIEVDIIGDADALNLIKPGQIALKSDPAKGISNPDLWSLTIGREILVAVTDRSNPYLSELKECGIKPSAISTLFSSRNKSWASILGHDTSSDIGVFCTDLSFTSQHLSALTGHEISEIRIDNKNASGNISADLRANKKSIGFCRLTDILTKESNSFLSDLEVIAIDINL